jgi:hypothetical protein
MSTVDRALTELGAAVRVAALTRPTPQWLPGTARSHRRRTFITRTVAAVVGTAALTVGAVMLFRVGTAPATTPSREAPAVATSQPAGPPTSAATTTTVAPDPDLWYLLDLPSWEILTMNESRWERGVVTVRYSMDPASVDTDRASLTTMRDPSHLRDDLNALFDVAADPTDRFGVPFGDEVDETVIVAGTEVQLVTFTAHFHYAMWTDDAGAGISLYANGPDREGMLELIDHIRPVTTEEWHRQLPAAALDAVPEASDWITVTPGVDLGIVRSTDTITVWSRSSAAGRPQLEYNGDRAAFTGFVTIPVTGDTSLVVEVDEQRAYSGPLRVFLADGTRLNASIEFNPNRTIGTVLVDHPAGSSIIQVVPAETSGG